MSQTSRFFQVALPLLAFFVCASQGQQKAHPSSPVIGGEPVLHLQRHLTNNGALPEFLSATFLPGRGMNVFQITAHLPGKGEVPLLASPSLQTATTLLNGTGPDKDGNESFMMGGALLFPFANRILGPATADGKFILATWRGRTVKLRANWRGSRPGAAPQALHGQLLMARATSTQLRSSTAQASATATFLLPANRHWFSSNRVVVHALLRAHSLTLTLTATNIGDYPEPVGIGWHPYFRLPSGNRANARLHIPATARAAVNDPDDMFPTGALLPIAGTPLDFTAPNGAALTVPVNDAFLPLQRTAQGHVVCSIADVAANYGLRITALTPFVKTILVYAPAGEPLVVLEPQFNNGDPFGQAWKGKDNGNGMVILNPGRSVTWKTQLTLFQPHP